MKRRVGILSEYYNSKNYGGVLQAYALCRLINNFGYECEQIQYYKSAEVMLQKKKRKKDFSLLILRRCVIVWTLNLYVSIRMSKRVKSFKSFRNLIPHSELVYDDGTLSNCIDKYDVFIVGSDQVWNPNYYHPGYKLEFINNKPKISYAASLGVSSLSRDQEDEFGSFLESFYAVSVREEDAVHMLQRLTHKPVQWVLDPTLLLTQKDWDNLSTNMGGVVSKQSKYIFAYFLGEEKKQREIAKQFAKKYGYKVVFIPFVHGYYRVCDEKFGDYRFFNVSPGDFISLIKNAEFIFTDSFHAVVFSCIYNKKFFVFSREDMDSRIKSIARLFGVESQFCDNDQIFNIELIEQKMGMSYTPANPNLKAMIERSIAFLSENISNSLEGKASY